MQYIILFDNFKTFKTFFFVKALLHLFGVQCIFVYACI